MTDREKKAALIAVEVGGMYQAAVAETERYLARRVRAVKPKRPAKHEKSPRFSASTAPASR